MTRLLAHKNHSLVSHLEDVSRRASEFAQVFGASEYARLSGLLHDLGKAETEFQKRINSDDKEGEKHPHAPHGAAFALRAYDPPQWLVAIAVNGHHAGLHNRGEVDQTAEKNIEKAKSCLEKIRLEQPNFAIPTLGKMLPEWLEVLDYLPGHKGNGWVATDLFTRFLFSALIDADRLDTEENSDDGEPKKQARQWLPFEPKFLLDRLEEELTRRTLRATSEGKASSEVMEVRRQVGDYCRYNAFTERGLFTLTVPTGGGKTLASMLFALNHAIHHNKTSLPNKRFRRIIVVIPYLNIIQQTAKEYRDLFEQAETEKGRIVLEHHSQVEDEPEPKGKKQEKERNDVSYDTISERRRLAAENWDAPIVVTTSVQFFESLFSRRPAKARKLHNIAQSIVIFDEVQTLPPLMLQPILNVLSELADPERPYGSSMVFCTATQPALGRSEDLPTGLKNVRPIVPPEDARKHFESLKRVKYRWPDEDEAMTWEDVADSVLNDDFQQALIVVNTRKAARELHRVVREKLGSDTDGLFHLSTWMMPSHRTKVLDEVKRRLDTDNQKDGRERCILVSTQCIEAGVDVDFPSVWRAFGPYDSIVQAAGRCNRNDLLDRDIAIVRVFRPKDGKTPQGIYSTAIAQTELLRKMGLAVPENPESFIDYFRLLYQLSVPDECGIQRARSRLHFKEVDGLFKIIEDNTISVLIRNQYLGEDSVKTPGGELYEKAQQRTEKTYGYFTREDWRVIQPYIINLPFYSLRDAEVNSKLESAFQDESAGLYVWLGAYRGGLQDTGIDFEGPMPPEDFIL
jgi:CRISPR-associated endonuclease/helicase Cas3